jgi:hypothetical protein
LSAPAATRAERFSAGCRDRESGLGLGIDLADLREVY